MNIAIWWIRRDLRLADNQSLWAALEQNTHILPVFILDPFLLNSEYTGEKRLAFLFAGLGELHKDLQRKGSRLIVRSGRPDDILAGLVAETGAREISLRLITPPMRDSAIYVSHRSYRCN